MESRGKRSKGITKQQLHVRRTVKQGNNFWVHRTSSLNGQMQSHHGLFPHRILRKSTELLLHSKFHRQACSSVRNLVCTSILQSLSSVFCAHNIFWVLSSGNVENFSQEISEIWVGMCCRLCVSCAGVALLAFVIAPTSFSRCDGRQACHSKEVHLSCTSTNCPEGSAQEVAEEIEDLQACTSRRC